MFISYRMILYFRSTTYKISRKLSHVQQVGRREKDLETVSWKQNDDDDCACDDGSGTALFQLSSPLISIRSF